MTNLRKTIFISDLHLEENRPDITQRFLQLLSQLDSTVDALYILGDLFETWIGDDYGLLQYNKIINSLKTVTQSGIPVYFLYGNRDFLIGKKFLRETGCQLLPDETKIYLYDQPVLLMHGDTLCTKDVAYIKARKKMRNHFFQTIFLLLPLKLRKKIANKLREKSKQHTSTTASYIMDVTQEEVMKVLHKHEVNCLVHGHTHRPGIHEFRVTQRPAIRIVLGAWHECGNMLVWDQAGNKELKDL